MLLRIPCWGATIYPAEHPWNGWVNNSFETGIYFPAFNHLLRCRRCRRENKIRKKEVHQLLLKLEEEWARTIRPIVIQTTIVIETCRLILYEKEGRRRYTVEGHLEREGNWMAYIHTAGFAWTYHGNVQRTMEYLTSLGLNAEQQ
jgi:hypothetical protein